MVSKEYEDKIVKQTRAIVEKFLESNLSDIELENIFGVSSSTIGRRLTDKYYISKAFPDNYEEIYNTITDRRRANLKMGKVVGAQAAVLNSLNQTDTPKLRLDVFYEAEDKQMKFLLHMLLTFRVKTSTASVLLRVDEDELYKKLISINKNSYMSLEFLNKFDTTNQEVAKEKFVDFYYSLFNAKRQKNVDEQRRLLQEIYDTKLAQYKAERKPADRITDEHIEMLLKYQLKYSYSGRVVASTFGINYSTYKRRVKEFAEQHPEYESRYDQLADFWSSLHRSDTRNPYA